MRRSFLPLLVVAGALLACRDPDPRCSEVRGSIPSKLSIGSCSDGQVREVACSLDETKDWMCACTRNGTLGRTFLKLATSPAQTDADRRELEEFLSRQCNWSLRLH